MTIRPECHAEALANRLLHTAVHETNQVDDVVYECVFEAPGEIELQSEVLIVGGGVAGCAASIALARKGRNVTLIEREATPRHKVCGEFLSGEALEDLHALGIDVASLGAVPINYVRLAAARRAAEAPLPFQAASLTRKALDTALIAEAIAAGVRVERGR